MRPQVGQLINNKYRLVRLLGDGGMGSVFEATHEVLGNSVALKFLHPELARRQGLVQRFLQEARVSAKIQSPHVVRVTDVEQTPTGLPFMVMDFLNGVSLQALYEDNYRAGKRVAYEDALNYSMQVLDGLEAAHEEGVVHRDLKPDNVMIIKGKRGEPLVKLLDFGIAKLKINGELYKGLTRPGVIMGTPEYMAPEQVFSADAVDARADIFSCGVIFFEMFAGRRPVGGDEAHQIAAAYLSGNVAHLKDLAPHIPDLLADAIHKAMAADPKDRFSSVQELRSAMEPHARDVVVRPAYTTPPPAVQASPAPSSDPKSMFAATAKAAPGDLARALESVRKSAPPASALGFASQGVASPAASLDGVAVASGLGVDGAMTDKVSEPWRGSGNDYAAISARLKANQAAGFDSTVEGAPLFPGSTEAYQPLARPGGTDVGASGAAVVGLPGTQNYDAAPAAPMVKSYGATPAPIRRKKTGLGLGAILLIGTAFAAAVVGGVYAYDQSRSGSSSKDDGKTVALPRKPTNKQAAAPPPIETMPPMITPPVATTPVKPTATNPGPKPTGQPSTKPTNTGSPVMIPTSIPGLPPIEFPFPGMGGQRQPAPKDPPKKEQGGPKLEPIPMRGANEAPDAAPSARPAAEQRPTRAEATPVKTRQPRTEARTPVKTKPTRTASVERPQRKVAVLKKLGAR